MSVLTHACRRTLPRVLLRQLHTTTFSHNNASQPAKVDVQLIKQLREMIGAPMSECKTALQHAQSSNDTDIIQAAIEWLRKSGKLAAAKKSTRSAGEGLVVISSNDSSACISEINSETDFAAKNDKFIELADNISCAVLQQSQHTDNISADHIGSIPVDTSNITETLTQAITSLRENILVRRSHRVTAQPHQCVATYIHNSIQHNHSSKLGKSGAIIVLNTPADTQLTNSQRQQITQLGAKLAMHVVALQPLYANKADVPQSVVDHEREVLLEQSQTTLKGKSADQLNKIVLGKLNKYYEENVLNEQKFVVVTGDEKPQAIHKVLSEFAKHIGVKSLTIDRFVRFAVGETIVKQEKMSFADEVKSKMM